MLYKLANKADKVGLRKIQFSKNKIDCISEFTMKLEFVEVKVMWNWFEDNNLCNEKKTYFII